MSVLIGTTTKITDFIEEMQKVDVEVIKFNMITEALFKRFFNKNKDKIDSILLVIMKHGEKAK